MTRRLSPDRVKAIQRAADAGTLTLRELAAEFGVSYRATWLAVHRRGVDTNITQVTNAAVGGCVASPDYDMEREDEAAPSAGRLGASKAGGRGAADPLEEARRTRIEIMRGNGGRNAVARLAAANKILEVGELVQLTDEQLEAEINRLSAEVHRRNALRQQEGQ